MTYCIKIDNRYNTGRGMCTFSFEIKNESFRKGEESVLIIINTGTLYFRIIQNQFICPFLRTPLSMHRNRIKNFEKTAKFFGHDRVKMEREFNADNIF